MIEQASSRYSENREYIWLVALYEQEERADELLERLTAIGVDTEDATTVRVEIDDKLRRARYKTRNEPALSPVTRGAISGALLGGSSALLLGLSSYALGLFAMPMAVGLFNHALACVMIGGLIGTMAGAVIASARRKNASRLKLPEIPQPAGEGYLVAVKMPPPLAERAEEIARGLGAKEILL
ncbi:MAG TPA: hypothetical protein PLD20_18010 [Blastocatellia bacterium]|nr:hypothetical protein [Blastocatellia bacterium]HMY76901.1 hypothetical protein [Blastocatellia bacterium]HMZ19836.1 hypothetical protein [Blastocatellia bacterium]HNG34480.1 hypothetical protein [Blastocatellia bacterium]